ncbi:hypothetical protein IVB69_05655 [Flavobacterium sp. J49]|uniref:hypothetical protein n=1 Tax=Flavobacterium sp. J49 TaxID=2718534 RepID=UPI0015936035|nr:hypothetical protein [Flavobacterium sp. J49]MBF6640236.1 hypothetical protein [Flavobacterium sp. J49]MBF6640237.1 hypothetical protein [Flavobacterium sp. J49]MBF6640957.1 hypothetical protein [Flavobacterium sp. J49]NIC01481.1 hypothetical protein [Flavobacterium sp. J49]NIC01482.1 hypothetical protein [Flavobacterium sp. J49]
MRKELIIILLWTTSIFAQENYNSYYAEAFVQVKKSIELKRFCEKLNIENVLKINKFNVSICEDVDWFGKKIETPIECITTDFKKWKRYRNRKLKRIGDNEKTKLTLTLSEISDNYFIGRVNFKNYIYEHVLYLFKIENGKLKLIESITVTSIS